MPPMNFFEVAFNVANCLPMPFWLAMIFFPNREWTRRLTDSHWVFAGLGTAYVVFLAWALATDPNGAGFGFHALRAGLSREVAFVAAWLHYLCFDLFVGFWIYKESRRLRIHAGIFLFFTLMLGPLGLTAFLIRRAWATRAQTGRG
jgi:hypothetical protein